MKFTFRIIENSTLIHFQLTNSDKSDKSDKKKKISLGNLMKEVDLKAIEKELKRYVCKEGNFEKVENIRKITVSMKTLVNKFLE